MIIFSMILDKDDKKNSWLSIGASMESSGAVCLINITTRNNNYQKLKI